MKTTYKDLWVDFINRTEYFKSTCVIEGAIDEAQQKLLFEGVKESLYNKIKLKHFFEGFRLWKGQDQIRDTETKEIFETFPPENDEDLISYCKRIFKKDRFGLILNNNEGYSEVLATQISQITDSLNDLIGIPPLGYEITLFIGNYGWTPIGIHKDSPGENVIHFHLGPGRKQMYTWDDETYEELVGKNVYNNKVIEPILNRAKKFDYGSGDIFFMPWFKNHVGYSEELSVGVTLWFKNANNANFSRNLIRGYLTNFMYQDVRMIPPQIDYLSNHDNFENFQATISGSVDVAEDLSLNNFLKDIYLDFKYCLMSNGGWSTVPIKLNQEQEDKESEELDLKYLVDKSIKTKIPFNILYRNEDQEKISIYVRGKRLKMKNHNDIKNLIEKLNKGDTIVIKDELKSIEMPEGPYLYFINLLSDYRGVLVE